MAGLKKVILFEGYAQVKEVDQDRLSELVTIAKGERTLQEFAAECGLNISTLSRIINKKNAGGSADSVLARIAIHADPESGVTIEKLLEAQGRAAMEGARSPREVLGSLALEDMLSDPVPSEDDADMKRRSAAQLTAMKAEQEEKKRLDGFRMTIQNALLMASHTVALSKDNVAIQGVEFDCYADFILETDALKDEGIEKWAFIRLRDTGNKACFGMMGFFGMMFLHNPVQEGRRVTFLTEDKATYQLLREMYRDAPVNASVSFMLVNTKELAVISEYVMERSDTKNAVKIFGEGQPVDYEELYGVPDDMEGEYADHRQE